MKKLLIGIGIVLGIIAGIALSAHAATTVCNVFNGCTGTGSFSPNSLIVSGNTSTSALSATSSSPLYVTALSATSTTATSTFAYSVQSTCFTVNGINCLSSSSGTVTSITAGTGLLGGIITTSGTITNTLATSSVITVGGMPYWTSTGSTGTALLGNVATSSLGVSTGLTSSGTLGAQVGGGNSVISFTAINANSLWANVTGASAVPTNIATSSLFSGTVGMGAYFSGTGTLVGTTTVSIDTTSRVGIGSTTPFALLSVNPTASLGTAPALAVGSSTQTVFSVGNNGTISLAEQQPATTTTMTLDWSKTPASIDYRIGNAATTITLINATTTYYAGSRKLITVCNPGSTASTVTWAGVEWAGGTAPTQTTTANVCDIYSLFVTSATSSSAFKVGGAQTTNLQ